MPSMMMRSLHAWRLGHALVVFGKRHDAMQMAENVFMQVHEVADSVLREISGVVLCGC